MTPDLLFVYGTMSFGQPAHSLLAGCRFAGRAAVRGLLAPAGGHVALIPNADGWVRGELYELPGGRALGNLLARLDGYEGVGQGLYRRGRVEAGGKVAWAYVAGPALDDQPDG